MHRRCLAVLLAVIVATLVATPTSTVSAQSSSMEKPRQYTYVSLWAVPRAQWGEYDKAEAASEGNYKKLMDSGAIVNWGSFVRSAHQEGEPTHGSWFSSTSLANLMHAEESFKGMVDAPVYANSKHWDDIYESRDYNFHSGTFTNAYLRVGVFKYRESGAQANAVTRATLGKALDGLVADSSLHGYTLQHEYIHTMDVNTFLIVIFCNGPEGLDKYSDMVDSMAKADPAGFAGFEANVNPAGHIDALWRIPTMASK